MSGPFYLNDGGPASTPSWETDGAPGIWTATLHLFALDGFVTAIRYYAGDTGTQVTLRLYQASTVSPMADPGPGGLLAEFTHTASVIGWQEAALPAPVAVEGSAGSRRPYVVARWHPSGYAFLADFFDASHGALTAGDPVYGPGDSENVSATLDPSYLAGWNTGSPNGRFVTDGPPPDLWPSGSGGGTYYGVDAVFFDSLLEPETVVLQPAEIVFEALPLEATPGPVTVALTPATVLFQAQQLLATAVPVPLEPSGLTWDLMVTAETCLCAAWDDLPIDQRPGQCGIVPGRDVAFDDCCSGQAWVRWARTFRTSTQLFPQPLNDQTTNCPDWMWGIELGVGVVRCAPGPDESGNPPTQEAMRAAALQIHDDVARVRAAIVCCFRESAEAYVRGKGASAGLLFQVGDLVSFGPQGGCHGFDMTVTLAVAECPCGEAPVPFQPAQSLW